MKVDWSKTAFVFPGQAYQVVGMGKDVAEAYPVAQDTFSRADEIIGFALSELMFSGPEEDLNDTINTQPAMYVCSIALLRALQQELPQARPVAAAGHSLGELTALTAAGALLFEDGVELVRERGLQMKRAGEHEAGGMAAILGLDYSSVEEICNQATEQTGLPVVLANDNCPGQIVISGDVVALEVAMELAKAAGARRALRIAVSIAPHSPLMHLAQDRFGIAVSATTFHVPRIPVYANITAQPLHNVEDIRKELHNQLTEKVHWTDTINNMIAAGIEYFVEIGSKDVLTGFTRRINKEKQGISINSLETLRAFVDANQS